VGRFFRESGGVFSLLNSAG